MVQHRVPDPPTQAGCTSCGNDLHHGLIAGDRVVVIAPMTKRMPGTVLGFAVDKADVRLDEREYPLVVHTKWLEREGVAVREPWPGANAAARSLHDFEEGPDGRCAYCALHVDALCHTPSLIVGPATVVADPLACANPRCGHPIEAHHPIEYGGTLRRARVQGAGWVELCV